MKIKTIYLSILLSSLALGSAAQQKGTISFAETTHDFGTIDEKNGNVSYTFQFTNTGNTPIIISNVSASCGCTSPSWTKEPILPQKTGAVTATYAPQGRPGPFDKTLTITSNAEPSTVVLHIKGNVKQAPLPPEQQYPAQFGESIRANSSTISFGRITKTSASAASIIVYNSGTSKATVAFENVPAHLSMKVQPATIAPKQTATVTCTYNAPKVADWGETRDYVSMKIDGQKISNFITVTATILDDFSKLSPADNASAPKLQFQSTTYSFSNVSQGSLINATFTLTNTGSKELIIRKAVGNSPNVKVACSKTTIKPNEKAEVRVSVNTKNSPSGTVTFPVTVYSNSPTNPQVSLLVSGTILK